LVTSRFTSFVHLFEMSAYRQSIFTAGNHSIQDASPHDRALFADASAIDWDLPADSRTEAGSFFVANGGRHLASAAISVGQVVLTALDHPGSGETSMQIFSASMC
jgi:hypothetical protein